MADSSVSEPVATCGKCKRSIPLSKVTPVEQEHALGRGGYFLCESCDSSAEAIRHPPEEPILKFFAWEHLASERMRAVSKGFAHLAHELVKDLPRCAERTVALRKLLEAKDAAVRAALP